MLPLVLVSILATRWRHLHCHIAWDCPLTSSVGIELLSSSARVTSVKSANSLGWMESVTSGPIDRTPGTPGSDKNWTCHQSIDKAFIVFLLSIFPKSSGATLSESVKSINSCQMSLLLCRQARLTRKEIKSAFWVIASMLGMHLLFHNQVTMQAKRSFS